MNDMMNQMSEMAVQSMDLGDMDLSMEMAQLQAECDAEKLTGVANV